jgi:2,4-dienoyl-CoA reductase-like NADH-dependent reductase (Old Yellow Enzyme family)
VSRVLVQYLIPISQIEPLAKVVTFIHSQSHLISIQIGHAGRKASTIAPWLAERGKAVLATSDIGGWPENVLGPSAIPWSEGYATPQELSIAEIKNLIRAFGDAAARAEKAGIDLIEIHGAHGYLIHEFMSGVSNLRNDEYGGSFENRTRFLVEVIQEVRQRIPKGMPLFLRFVRLGP